MKRFVAICMTWRSLPCRRLLAWTSSRKLDGICALTSSISWSRCTSPSAFAPKPSISLSTSSIDTFPGVSSTSSTISLSVALRCGSQPSSKTPKNASPPRQTCVISVRMPTKRPRSFRWRATSSPRSNGRWVIQQQKLGFVSCAAAPAWNQQTFRTLLVS